MFTSAAAPYTPSSEEISSQFELLKTHRQHVAVLLKQRAQHGDAYAPPAIILGIHHSRAEIKRIKDILRSWKQQVKDEPNDDEPPEVVLLRKLRQVGLLALFVILAGLVLYLGNRSWPCIAGTRAPERTALSTPATISAQLRTAVAT